MIFFLAEILPISYSCRLSVLESLVEQPHPPNESVSSTISNLDTTNDRCSSTITPLIDRQFNGSHHSNVSDGMTKINSHEEFDISTNHFNNVTTDHMSLPSSRDSNSHRSHSIVVASDPTRASLLFDHNNSIREDVRSDVNVESVKDISILLKRSHPQHNSSTQDSSLEHSSSSRIPQQTMDDNTGKSPNDGWGWSSFF